MTECKQAAEHSYRTTTNSGNRGRANYTLPGGASLFVTADTSNNVAVHSFIPDATTGVSSIAFANESAGVLADFITIFAAAEYVGFQASETVLRLCVQTYSTEVINGIANTNVTAWNTNFDLPSDIQDIGATGPDGVNYTLSSLSNEVLVPTLTSLLNGTYAIVQPDGGGGSLSLAMQAIASNIYNPPYDIAGINILAGNIATSMTNQYVEYSSLYLHNLGEQPITSTSLRLSNGTVSPALGLAKQETTHVHVEWPWLSLMIISICFTLLFLILVILKTRAARVLVWKSSAIAPFFIMPGNASTPESTEGLGRVSAAEEKARTMECELVGRDEGWVLQRVGMGNGKMGYEFAGETRYRGRGEHVELHSLSGRE